MGVKLSTAQMRKLGYTNVAGHWRQPLEPAQAGAVVLQFKGNPPTTTHQAKRFGVVRGRPVLFKSDRLQDAEAYFASQLPARVKMIPVAPPVLAIVTFRFYRDVHDCAHIEAPDCDNLSKVLFDQLAIAGWIANDSHVADKIIGKRWSKFAGVTVYLESNTAPFPLGLTALEQEATGWKNPGTASRLAQDFFGVDWTATTGLPWPTEPNDPAHSPSETGQVSPTPGRSFDTDPRMECGEARETRGGGAVARPVEGGVL